MAYGFSPSPRANRPSGRRCRIPTRAKARQDVLLDFSRRDRPVRFFEATSNAVIGPLEISNRLLTRRNADFLGFPASAGVGEGSVWDFRLLPGWEGALFAISGVCRGGKGCCLRFLALGDLCRGHFRGRELDLGLAPFPGLFLSSASCTHLLYTFRVGLSSI